MERFINDGNNQRIIRVKDDKPDNVPMNEAYVQYAIPYTDIDGLIEVLKSRGDIKKEVASQGCSNPVNATVTAAPISVFSNPEDIICKQADIIDRQLGIIQTFISK